MSPFDPSRHFVAVQQSGRFRPKQKFFDSKTACSVENPKEIAVVSAAPC
jgi:hypothetical protein